MQGLGVSARVLMVGAHPDDEDTYLIAWLSRGRHVTTGYLSLTRGDGGQNLIGNELGEALGVIRTEELLAARRIDGGLQYFTRAFDFGFSKDTVDTFRHWQRDTILGDVVRVVRALRPHVIVAVFSGTPRDGHGHHQVSGILAREAYEVAGDTVRFPPAEFGPAWTPLKFYRTGRFNAQAGTLMYDAGEYSPLLGRSYAEIAGESRSQHKSQGFGALQRKGPLPAYVRREATRVNEGTPADREQTLLDGVDTSWARFRSAVPAGPARAALDSLPAALTEVRSSFDAFDPTPMVGPLLRLRTLLGRICPMAPVSACARMRFERGALRRFVVNGDLDAAIGIASERVQAALSAATGISVDALAAGSWAVGAAFPVVATLYNRGRDSVTVGRDVVVNGALRQAARAARVLPAGGSLTDTLTASMDTLGGPWWLAGGRADAMFTLPGGSLPENLRGGTRTVHYMIGFPGRQGGPVSFGTRIESRAIDDVRGEVRAPVDAVPGVAVSVGEGVQFAPANLAFEREVRVRLKSAFAEPRDVQVDLTLPPGLAADSAARRVRLNRYGDEAEVSYGIRGRLTPGSHEIRVVASSSGQAFATGYQVISYEHIRPQRVMRPAAISIRAVDVRVPTELRVAYVPGVGDNVAPMLAQLGVSVTTIPSADLARADLTPFSALVIGPRAYEASPELAAANPRIFDFARRGRTVVVQYGQYEMTRTGMTPYPITINRPHDRVTLEDAPITLLDTTARELSWPNRITAADFDGWVQERGLYMPRTFDDRYRPLVAANDPGEAVNRGGILVAPLGDGVYVYTSLSLFRQLPAGVPGAARLFVNLLSAGLDPTGTVP